jgi:tetratricopeptide (TPR) repeat protein
MTLGILGEDIGAMIMLTDRALALNPNYASGWHQSGNLRLWAGYPEIAIEHLEIAQRLSPRMQLGHWRSLIGVAHFLSKRFDQAVSNLILAIQQDQCDPVPYRYLAASYAHMGRANDAQEIVARLHARLSDKTSRLHLRRATTKLGQAYAAEVLVKVREWISSALAGPIHLLVSEGAYRRRRRPLVRL